MADEIIDQNDNNEDDENEDELIVDESLNDDNGDDDTNGDDENAETNDRTAAIESEVADSEHSESTDPSTLTPDGYTEDLSENGGEEGEGIENPSQPASVESLPIRYKIITNTINIPLDDYLPATIEELRTEGKQAVAVFRDSTTRQVSWDDVFDPSTLARPVIKSEVLKLAEATNQHFWSDNNGIHVTDEEKDDWNTEYEKSNHGQLNTPTNSNPWHNILINSLGILLRRGLINYVSVSGSAIAFYDGAGNNDQNIMANFGSTAAQIGKSSYQHINLTSSGLDIQNGSGVSQAFFGATARIGASSENHIVIDTNGVHTVDANGDGIPINGIYIEALSADTAKIHNLTATQLSAAVGYIDALTTNNISASDLSADTAKIHNLTATQLSTAVGYIDALTTNNISASDLSADHASISNLDTNYAQINLANVDNAWINNGTVRDGAITNAMINSVSANKLTAGTIDASQITVTNLNADNITAGTINGQRIGQGSLSLDKLSDPVYTETEIDSMLDTMQAEIDGAIETWTGNNVPTLNNTPANSWTTNADKDRHVGDVYFVVNSQSQQNGYNYRFTKTTSGGVSTYSWQLIKDNDVTAALQRLETAEGQITQFDSDISQLQTDTGSLTTRTTSLEGRMGNAEDEIDLKVDTTTFNQLSNTVDGHTSTITSLSNTVESKADSSTVNTLSNTVNSVSQTASGNSSKISQLVSTLGTNTDGTTKDGDIVHRTSAIEQDLSGFKSTVSETYATQDNLSGVSTIANRANNKAVAYSGNSTTSSTSSAKVVVCDNFPSSIQVGTTITVRFSNANTYSSGSITLNVNSTGANTIYVGSSQTSSTNQLLWAANASVTFTYDGTYWRVVSEPRSWYGTCSIAANVVEKTVSINEAVICKGTSITLSMTYDNTSTSATLNVSSTGAKNIYYGTSTTRPTTENDYGWTSGSTVTLVFDGAYWRLGDTSALAGISSLKTTVSQHSTSIQQNSEAIQLRATSADLNALGNRVSTAEANITINADNIESKVSKDGVISSINQSSESVTINANRVNITGTAVFSAINNDTGTTKINGGKIDATSLTISQNQVTNLTTDLAAKASSSQAVTEEQYIYITKPSGTGSIDGTTTWITATTYSANTWTTKRPQYDSSYPVLFVAKQRKTVSGAVTCTTPLIDDTTTVIDGGHITTGTIDANRIATGSLSIGHVAGLQTTLNDKTNITQLDDAINNINVGGRNILRDTKAVGRNGVSATDTGYLRNVGIYEGSTYLGLTIVTVNRSSVSPFCEWIINDMKPNEEYTLSFWAKGDKSPRCYLHGPNFKFTRVYKTTTARGTCLSPGGDGNSDEAGGFDISETEWRRFWVTWKMANVYGQIHQNYALIRNDNLGTIYVCGVKLERGNKATDWTPAPEDVALYTDSQVSTAKSEAISTAATDATNKANQAAKTATNYITATTSDGIKVHDASDTTTYIQIVANAIDMVRSGTSMLRAWLDGTVTKVRVGMTSSAHILMDSGGMTVYDENGNDVGNFSGKVRLGSTSAMHMEFDGTRGNLNIYDDSDTMLTQLDGYKAGNTIGGMLYLGQYSSVGGYGSSSSGVDIGAELLAGNSNVSNSRKSDVSSRVRASVSGTYGEVDVRPDIIYLDVNGNVIYFDGSKLSMNSYSITGLNRIESSGTLTLYNSHLSLSGTSNHRIIIKAAEIIQSTTPSTDIYIQPTETQDKNGTIIGHDEYKQDTSMALQHNFAAVRQTNSSGTLTWYQCGMKVTTTGTVTYSINTPAAFRSAIGAAASSDRRLKTDLKLLDEDAVEFVKSLKSYSYLINGERQVGLIAQDVYEADKWGTRMAFETQDGLDGLDEWEKLGDGIPTWKLDYIRLIPPTITTLQKAMDKIEILEMKIETLEMENVMMTEYLKNLEGEL